MRRFIVLGTLFCLGLLVAGWSVTRAQESTPLPQGAVGITAAVLGATQPAAADGYELQLFRSEWEPGSTISTHTHPGALIGHFEAGAFGFRVLEALGREQPQGTPPELFGAPLSAWRSCTKRCEVGSVDRVTSAHAQTVETALPEDATSSPSSVFSLEVPRIEGASETEENTDAATSALGARRDHRRSGAGAGQLGRAGGE